MKTMITKKGGDDGPGEEVVNISPGTGTIKVGWLPKCGNLVVRGSFSGYTPTFSNTNPLIVTTLPKSLWPSVAASSGPYGGTCNGVVTDLYVYYLTNGQVELHTNAGGNDATAANVNYTFSVTGPGWNQP